MTFFSDLWRLMDSVYFKFISERRNMNLFLVEAYDLRRIFNIYRLYRKSFPIKERKPFLLMLQKRKKKIFDILSIEDDKGTFIGLAIIIKYKDLALLDYFSILPDKRSGGIGSEAFSILKSRYGKYRFILEIENTYIETPDIVTRKRRKNFYLKNNMSSIPFLVNLFGVEMELMGNNCNVTFEEYHSIFKDIFGKVVSSNVRLIKKIESKEF